MSYKTLLVDDSAAIRAMIVKILQIAGVPVGELWEASNGSKALEILNENWVDLVLTGINMPVMNGMKTIEQMGTDEVVLPQKRGHLLKPHISAVQTGSEFYTPMLNVS